MPPTPYIFPGLGTFLDRAKLDPAAKSEVLRLHGKHLNRISDALVQASMASSPEAAAELVANARRHAAIGPVVQSIAEAMIAEVAGAVGAPASAAAAKKPRP